MVCQDDEHATVNGCLATRRYILKNKSIKKTKLTIKLTTTTNEKERTSTPLSDTPILTPSPVGCFGYGTVDDGHTGSTSRHTVASSASGTYNGSIAGTCSVTVQEATPSTPTTEDVLTA